MLHDKGSDLHHEFIIHRLARTRLFVEMREPLYLLSGQRRDASRLLVSLPNQRDYCIYTVNHPTASVIYRKRLP